ncbi:hypothetical protein T03_13263 [Trichinella britovi]|uniref:Uncharacterized protein n=3 Tax=Trichinella TaxID=6333 RepID=A0A0V1CGT6_TRIBR|nr:hypothetical protein T05_4392 [Trichinella murrelli]KRX54228.1 hypothetical protein T09_8948 [Trichinella sp. T9]KRY20490.1 hypothetical protein T12_11378 [Trichinella patagoniensis]KRY48344.1 hypothetical protein T03_13263 [Trichinella britovi]KRZ84658.1 hypothetical protein T08_368 [Trichinella sp. T8]
MGNGGNQVYDKAINTIPAWSEQNLQNDGSTPPAAPCIISIPFSRLRTHGTNLSLQICPRLVKEMQTT